MNKYKLSICIPTYNRLECLNNCLNSILIAKKKYDFKFEVCISDNCSDEDIDPIVKKYKNYYNIKKNKNEKNLGLGVNILKAVSLAEGEFVWILGNDDLLLPETFKYIDLLFKKNLNIDFYYINSFNLDSAFLNKFQKPFDTYNLPKTMKKFSSYSKSFKSNFFDLIDPKISFDFILGMFLAIFKKKIWDDNLFVINKKLVEDKNIYSTFENTAPHVMIWASGFKNSKAYFQSQPLSVNTYGVREWIDLYPFVESIRIPEVLEHYRKNGLKLSKYLYNKNFALRKLLINLFKIYFLKDVNGSSYINFSKHVVSNLFYPSIYIGLIYFTIRKMFKLIFKLKL